MQEMSANKKPTTSLEFVKEWFLKAAKTAKAQGRNDSAQLWKDGLEHLEALEKENESLKCCGNCKWRRFTLMGYYCHEYCSVEVLESSGYCPQWQSDGMTRAERKGK